MIWTTRLKRHGGLAAVAACRARQLRGLQMVMGRRAQDAENAMQWLAGNSLRVLSYAEERHFRIRPGPVLA